MGDPGLLGTEARLRPSFDAPAPGKCDRMRWRIAGISLSGTPSAPRIRLACGLPLPQAADGQSVRITSGIGRMFGFKAALPAVRNRPVMAALNR